MSNSFKLPRCPYCHKKISYIGSMFMKTKGEHNCGSCKCISNVIISRGAYALASAVCIVALLIVVLYTIGGDHGSYMGIACVLAPFIIFYITIPFFVKLVPCKDKSAVKKILDKRASAMPNETAFQAIQNSSKPAITPVTLDVEEDFSAKFMKAKKNNIEKNAADRAGQDELPDGEPEDIGNTKIDFEISEDRITEGVYLSEDETNSLKELDDPEEYTDDVQDTSYDGYGEEYQQEEYQQEEYQQEEYQQEEYQQDEYQQDENESADDIRRDEEEMIQQ